MIRFRASGLVLQGRFLGSQPAFAVPSAPTLSHHPQGPATPRGQVAQPSRIGNAFQIPATIALTQTGPGRPLPETVRRKMESFFNTDFSDVRVHVGIQAKSIGALAFTLGPSIHFAPGQYDPGTSHGQRLLGHELTHVVQQRAGRVRNPFGSGVAVVQDPALEAEAERLGLQAAAHQAPAPRVPPGGLVQPRREPAQSGRPAAPHVQAAVVQARRLQPQAPILPPGKPLAPTPSTGPANGVILRKVGFEYEIGTIETQKSTAWFSNNAWVAHGKGEVIKKNTGYSLTADINANGGSQVEFILHEIDEDDDNAVQGILRAAREVVDDIKALTAPANRGQWVQGNNIPRINGSRWVRFCSNGRYNQIRGQLQMTAGVRVKSLPKVVSGTARGRKPQNLGNQESFYDYSDSYSSTNFKGEPNQPVWHAAIEALKKQFPRSPRKWGLLASVITLMAQIPLDLRGSLSQSQALLLARTDYSKILLEVTKEYGGEIPQKKFLSALMETINSLSAVRIASTDGVFPAGAAAHGQDLSGLSIGDWVRSMMPTSGMLGWWQGKDLLTKQHFPGTQAQKDELRSYGGLGSKTDPGNRIIMEWRNLTMNNPEELPVIIEGLINYVRRANQ